MTIGTLEIGMFFMGLALQSHIYEYHFMVCTFICLLLVSGEMTIMIVGFIC